MSNRFRVIPLILILGLSFCLRITNLDKSPPTINWDEASLGYNAYSLLKTGKDEWGKKWPLSLKSFSDYKPALYAYLAIPGIKYWGLNQTTTRLPSAVMGTVSLIGVWLILGFFVKNYWQKILLLVLISFEPWRLHFSRTALETNVSAAIFVFGVYCIFRSIKSQVKMRWLLMATIILALSAYGYHSARLSGPVLIILFSLDPLNWIWERKISSSWKYISLVVVFGLLIRPVFLEANTSEVLTRFRQENIFMRYWPYAPKEIFNYSVTDWIRLNPLYYLGEFFSGHLLAYISPVNYTTMVFGWIRNSVQFIPEFNMIGWIDGIGLIIGIGILIGRIKMVEYRILVYWLIAGVAPAVLTWNWFHALRMLNAMVVIEVMIGLGILSSIEIISSKYKIIAYLTLGTLIFWQSIFVVNNELNYSVYENHGEYQPGGFEEGSAIIKSIERDYDQIVVDSPHAQNYIFTLFYQQYEPEIVQSYANSRVKVGENGSWNFNFNKYVFRKINWAIDSKLRKTILWMPSIINQSDIDKVPGAKAYFIKSPINIYNTSVVILLN